MSSDAGTRISQVMSSEEKVFLRVVLSVVAAALFTAALWLFVPDNLSVSTDIVGYPIDADFDYLRLTYGYYFIAFMLPLIAIGLYQLIAWKGPLRYQGGDRPPLFPLRTVPELGTAESKSYPGDPIDPDSADRSGPTVSTRESPESGYGERPPRTNLVNAIWAGARILLPMVAIVIEVSVIQSPRHSIRRPVEYLAAGLYLVAVLLLAIAFRTFHGRGARSQQPDGSTFRISIARANSLLAIVVVPLLFFVSRSTTVGVGSQAHLVHYPWLPWWLVGTVTLICLVLWLRSDLRARGSAHSVDVEARILTWVVGPVLIFLAMGNLPGAFGAFQGFDDAQFLAGPQLIFQHGFFPWRDIYLIHGLLEDVFDGKIGMVLFGNTRWGSNAGIFLLVNPVNWIVLYYFTAYFCRKNRLILVALTVAIACGLLMGLFPRFLLLPIFFITFDAVLRRPTWPRCWLFMATLTIGAILTPEETLFLPCLLIPLVLFEATGRTRGQSFSTSFPRTWRCAVAGTVLLLAWLVVLAGTGSLTAFIDYFRVFSSGHDLEGALPPAVYLYGRDYMVVFMWSIPILLWLATVARVVVKLRLRRVWAPSDWVMMAAAAISVTYYTKALGRADLGHVTEAFSVSIPLLILWSVEVLSAADRTIQSMIRRRPTTHGITRRSGVPAFRHVATFAALLAIIAGTAARATTIPFVLGNIPADFHPRVPVKAISALPRLGYTMPGSVDTVQIRELRSMLDRYAGPTAPVFDYSNELGVVYYLLNRTPGTRYYYAAVVQTQLAQQQDIAQLQESRPPVVIFSNATFGLMNYDSIPQAIRSYAVSTYLYAHYRPLMDVKGQLLLLRDDLFASAPPVPPGFQTTNLYFDTPACNFGDIPNFFALPSDIATRPRVRIPVTNVYTTVVTGSAMEAATKEPVELVLEVVDGQVVAAAKPSPDSDYTINDTGLGTIDLYALNADGSVTPLEPMGGSGSGVVGVAPLSAPVALAHHVYPVIANEAIGKIASEVSVPSDVSTLNLPAGVSTTHYQWLELSGSNHFKTASFTLTDQIGAPSGHNIEFNTLSSAGKHQVYVGVGSCLQWQGYGSASRLYLQRTGKTQPTSISVTLVG
jgi:hypothetical protein